MKAFYSSTGSSLFAETQIKYGQQEVMKDGWKDIISIQNPVERRKKIDNVISLMERDKEENGFISRDEVVEINKNGNGFKIDDNEIYYLFFDTLKYLKENKTDANDEALSFLAVKSTVKNYFGGFGGNREERMKLTEVNEFNDLATPSISAQKGKNCSLCVERSSVAHNLWLLTGEKSYYVNSKDCNFGNVSNEYANDGHAFCIVEIGGVQKLFDTTMQIYRAFHDFNPVEKMLNGEPFEITKEDQKYTYANASTSIKHNR